MLEDAGAPVPYVPLYTTLPAVGHTASGMMMFGIEPEKAARVHSYF